MIAEVRSILEGQGPERVYVLYFDAVVQKVETYEAGQRIDLNPVGGGATEFGPCFEWLDERGIRPQCLVFLTDLYGSFPPSGPAYPFRVNLYHPAQDDRPLQSGIDGFQRQERRSMQPDKNLRYSIASAAGSFKYGLAAEPSYRLVSGSVGDETEGGSGSPTARRIKEICWI